ncbi:hypothetical protein AB0H83_09135 [Dactylosporangium sp. NPDC050688]|uniref:hypothetical protein n=1 Tax=Dactylosporangium sp. NPDC050688 TaxID=3157217 RepID=UPI0033CEF741
MAFIDREVAVERFEGLCRPGSDGQVLLVWGMAGQGKSTLLRHLAGSDARKRILDLDDVVDRALFHDQPAYAVRTLVEPLFEQLAGVLLGWCRPWMRPWHRRRYRRAARAALRHLVEVHNTVELTARTRAVIRDNDVRIDTARPGVVDDQLHYRSALRDALLDLAGRLPRGRRVLMVDTSELLSALDISNAARVDGGPDALSVGHWFTYQVLGGLLEQAPDLRMVLAGRNRLALPSTLAVEAVELTEWQARHTAEFLDSVGLTEPWLAEAIHDACGGLPIWTQMLAATCLEARAAGEPVDRGWIARQAADRPAREWLTAQFLHRLPDELRDAVIAVAVLRTASKQLVAAMVPPATRPPPQRWFEQLAAISFVSVARSGELRAHALVRLAVLRYLSVHEPGERERLHRAAAAWYAATPGGFVEHAYHAFAYGDGAPAERFLEMIDTAYRAGSYDQVVSLTSVLVTEEQSQAAAVHLPEVVADAAMYAARVARLQGRDDEREAHLQRARDLYAAAGQVQREACARRELAELDLERDQCVRALEGFDASAGVLAESPWRGDHVAALRGAAEARRRLGALAAAKAQFETTLAAAERHGAVSTMAECRLGAGLVMISTGDYAAAAESLEASLALAAGLGTTDAARCTATALRGLATIAQFRNEWDRLGELLDRAGEVSAAAGDRRGMAATLVLRGRLYTALSRYAEADESFTAALSAAEEAGDRRCEARALFGLADLEEDVRSRPLRAEALHERARIRFEELGDRQGLLECRYVSAKRLAVAGDRDRASILLDECRAECEELGLRRHLAQVLGVLGDCAAGPQAQFELYSLARDEWAALGDRLSMADNLSDFALLALDDGQPEAASRLLEEIKATVAGVAAPADNAAVLALHSTICFRADARDEAAALLANARQIYESIGHEAGIVSTYEMIGRIAFHVGDVEEAFQILAEAQARVEANGDLPTLARLLENFADVQMSRDEPAVVERLANRAMELYEQMGNEAGKAGCLLTLAGAAGLGGDLPRALELARAAVDLALANGETVLAAKAQLTVATMLVESYHLHEAAAILRQVLPVLERYGARREVVQGLAKLATIVSVQGDPKEAAELFEKARVIAEARRDELAMAEIHLSRGSALARHPVGRFEAAAHVRAALEIFRRLRMYRYEQECLKLLKLLPRMKPKRAGQRPRR